MEKTFQEYKIFERLKISNIGEIDDEEAKYWQQYECKKTMEENIEIIDLKISPIEPYNYAISTKNQIIEYKKTNINQGRIIASIKSTINTFEYRRDGEIIGIGDFDGYLYIYAVVTKTFLRKIKCHHGKLNSIAFHKKHNITVTGGDDGKISLVDISTGTVYGKIEAHNDRITALIFTKAENLISISHDGFIKVWENIENLSKKPIKSVFKKDPIEKMISLGPNETFAISIGGKIESWDLNNLESPINLINAHMGKINTLCYSKRGKIISGGEDKILKVIDLIDGIKFMEVYPFEIKVIAISPDDKKVLILTKDGKVISKIRKDAISQNDDKKWLNKGNNLIHKSNLAQINKLSLIDKLLKKIKYDEALSCALETQEKPVIMGLIEELKKRKALKNAISKSKPKTIIEIINFISENISYPKFTLTLVTTAIFLIDEFNLISWKYPEILNSLIKIQPVVQKLVDEVEKYIETMGFLQIIINFNNFR